MFISKHNKTEYICYFATRAAATKRLRGPYPLPIGIARVVQRDGQWAIALRRCSEDAWVRFPNPNRYTKRELAKFSR